MVNKRESEAHLAQTRDLEERRAKTSEFVPSRTSDLSIADASRLSHTKWRNEDRQQTREALGYYRDWKSTENQAPLPDGNNQWATTGKAHTTEGQNMTTRTWQAPDPEGKREEAPAPKVTTRRVERSTNDTKPSPTVNERQGNQTESSGTPSSQPVEQGCGCVIL